VAHVVAAQEVGAEVHARERVSGWRVESGEVFVTTNRDTYRALKMIVTAGPWARKLGSDSILMKFGLWLALFPRESKPCSRLSDRPPWCR
jgi:glycine/D-amino acid oxidase-like deaminating enzyme